MTEHDENWKDRTALSTAASPFDAPPSGTAKDVSEESASTPAALVELGGMAVSPPSRRRSRKLGAPAWMVTFADLMSLLLVLFVLLLTFAELDIERYRQLAGSFKEAFGIQYQDRLAGVIELEGNLVLDKPRDIKQEDTRGDELPQAKGKPAALGVIPDEVVAEQTRQLIAQEIKDTTMTVERNRNEVIIRLPSSLAFPVGSASLSPAIGEALGKIADILANRPEGEIIVSGHTDDTPIFGGEFLSNWDLSAARATAVVHFLLNTERIQKERFTIRGYGDSRPLVPNDTEENKAKNRRVEIAIVTRLTDVQRANFSVNARPTPQEP